MTKVLDGQDLLATVGRLSELPGEYFERELRRARDGTGVWMER